MKLRPSARSARALRLKPSTVLAEGSASLGGAGSTYVFVRFKRGMARRLFGRRAVVGTLTLEAADGAGNPRRLVRTVTLRR